ncbi:hypothetical protein [Nocardioides sp. LHG3406-4]|uniref:hypothetical protein n=1 Tax=Nocardioides sp. LHG3406-4 TaxID=2804575 RepID=UPI003CF4E50E
MRRTVAVCLSTILATLSSGPSLASPADHQVSAPLARTTCAVFPTDNYWHADIRDLPTHPSSDRWLARMSTDRELHPDFGDRYGIPVTVVGGGHRKVRVRFLYADESDRLRYPLGKDTRIEGGRSSDGDRHAVVVDRKTCRLYETFATRKAQGRWRAGSGATWSLRSNALRPDGWTSADAAGLPILPGLLRWDEVRERRVDHAIRFTTDVTSRWHVWPARHYAGSQGSHDYPPMGARFRLEPDFPLAGFGADAVEVIRAMQTYGLVLADNGSPWFFQGEKNRRWPDRLVEELKEIPASAFEAVDTSPLQVSADSAAVR